MDEISTWRSGRRLGLGLAIAFSLFGFAAALATAAQSPIALAEQETGLIWQSLQPLPDKVGLAGAFAGATQSGLLVAGGANFPERPPWDGGAKVYHDRIWLLAQPEAEWSEVGKLARPLAYGVSASTPNGLICVGGSDRERHYASVSVIEYSKGRLHERSLAELPAPLANACGGVIGQTLFICGGIEAPDSPRPSAKLWSLNLADEKATWNELPECPGGPRMLSTGAVTAEAFYVFGGADLKPGANKLPQRVYRRDAWVFRPGQGWKQLADLPSPVVAAPSPAPVTRAGMILVLGGDTGELVGFQPVAEHPGFSRQIWSYDPLTNQWRDFGTAAVARVTVPVAAWQGGWLLCSGESRPGVRSPEVWSLRERPSQ
jgi:N-acetylneuraminic acid mutarotase